MADCLSIENMGVSYSSMKALAAVSFEVQAGEILGVSGANGAGKTSLLRGIAGLVPLSAGSVSYNGQVINGGKTRRSARSLVQGGLCLVPEGRRLFAGLSVEDHLRFGSCVVGTRDAGPDLDRVFAVFPKLEERRRQDVASLSGGEKQMVAIGRALMCRPRVLLIDELSLGLAPVVVNELVDALLALNAGSGVTLILVDECLGRLGSAVSRVVVLGHGRVQGILGKDQIDDTASSIYFGSAEGG